MNRRLLFWLLKLKTLILLLRFPCPKEDAVTRSSAGGQGCNYSLMKTAIYSSKAPLESGMAPKTETFLMLYHIKNKPNQNKKKLS